MASPKGGTALEPSFVARAAGAVRYLLTGKTGKAADGFFGPNQPIPPVAQDAAAGRAFDFPTGYNLQTRPRAGEAVDFGTLRALADNYDLLRLAIETRKDQMGKLQWTIVRRDGEGDAESDPQAKAIRDFLEEPDGEHDFLTWQRMLLEDLLVIDAPTCYIRPTLGGLPFAFEAIDGATIKRVIDGSGRTPIAPDPAYQQIIKGLPAVDYHRDELVYYPRNQRTHKVYGYSPVEQIVMIVNIALRREVAQLEYYTEGNIPDVFLSTPLTWNPDQIALFQKLWDELLAGDTGARRRARFIPGGMDPHAMKTESLFDPFDEWLARVVCYAFSLPPNAFVKQQNRATAESAQEVALEEGLSPLMEWEVRFMNRLIRLGWKTRDYVFAWQDEQEMDPLVQAQIDILYAGGAAGTGPKIRSVQEIRDDHDWGPLPADLKAEQDQKAEMGQVALETAKNPPPAVDPKQEQENQQTKQNAEKVAGALEQVVDRLGKLEEHAAVPPVVPPASSPAQDFAALVEHGVPPNQALKLAGIETAPIADGDTSLVKATLVPLTVATDPRSLAPAPAKPVEKLEKKSAPLPPIEVKTGDTTIHLTMPPAPNAPTVKRTVQFKKNELGDLESAEITDEEVTHGE